MIKSVIDKKMICYECSGKIDPTEHLVQISTYNRFSYDKVIKKLDDEHTYFHFQCFVDYWNKKSMEKARNSVKFMQSKALQILENPAIKNILEKIEGIDAIKQLMNTPLEETTIVTKEKVRRKIENDRKKTKRKSKSE